MAHDKLNEDDDGFIALPEGALLVSSGVNGCESFIARDRTATVRIVIAAVAVATSGGATLEAAIEAPEGAAAKSEDGPAEIDHHRHLNAALSVQVVVKEGERLAFKAYPTARGARVLRTVVFTTDVRGG